MKRTDIYRQKQNSFLRRSLHGYLRFFRGILWILIAVCLVALTGFLIVCPLWYFASEYRGAYSLFALGILFLTALAYLAGRFKTQVRAAGGLYAWLTTKLWKQIKKLARVFLAVLALYGVILLFTRGYTLAAAGGALVYLVFLGVILAGRRESQ